MNVALTTIKYSNLYQHLANIETIGMGFNTALIIIIPTRWEVFLFFNALTNKESIHSKSLVLYLLKIKF